MNYGKLAEQYGSFLVAIGGVSITVLTLVLAMWHLKPDSSTSRENEADANNRSTLIKALMIATFCSFVGAHLMAETAAFVGAKGNEFGVKQFVWASINIFIGVPVVMFAVMLLAREYKKDNQRLTGIRSIASWVFRAVVVCVFWWMCASVLWRMPSSVRLPAFLLVAVILIGMVVKRALRRKKNKEASKLLRKKNTEAMSIETMERRRKKRREEMCRLRKSNTEAMELLLSRTFKAILVFTPFSLFMCSLALSDTSGGAVSLFDAICFVLAITCTCVSLFCVSLSISPLRWPRQRKRA
jgi:predicted permease